MDGSLKEDTKQKRVEERKNEYRQKRKPLCQRSSSRKVILNKGLQMSESGNIWGDFWVQGTHEQKL